MKGISIKRIDYLAANTSQSFSLTPSGGGLGASASITVLKNEDLEALNSFSDPNHISPKTEDFNLENSFIQLSLAPQSLNIIKVKITG